jgi:hypothetical protein
MIKTRLDTAFLDTESTGRILRLSVALLVSSIVGRLRLKRRLTVYATDASRATATALRVFYLCVLCVLCV